MSNNQSSARRRLNFDDDGDDDQNNDNGDNGHNQNAANIFHESMARLSEEKEIQWNFSFKTGKPLSGDWQWTPVTQTIPNTTILSSTSEEAPVMIEKQCTENHQVEDMDCDLVTSSTSSTPESLMLEDQTTPRKPNGTHE